MWIPVYNVQGLPEAFSALAGAGHYDQPHRAWRLQYYVPDDAQPQLDVPTGCDCKHQDHTAVKANEYWAWLQLYSRNLEPTFEDTTTHAPLQPVCADSSQETPLLVCAFLESEQLPGIRIPLSIEHLASICSSTLTRNDFPEAPHCQASLTTAPLDNNEDEEDDDNNMCPDNSRLMSRLEDLHHYLCTLSFFHLPGTTAVRQEALNTSGSTVGHGTYVVILEGPLESRIEFKLKFRVRRAVHLPEPCSQSAPCSAQVCEEGRPRKKRRRSY